MRRILLRDRDSMYELYVEGNGRHYLSVVVGGVAMYEVIVELTESEVERFQEEGQSFIHDLAYRVSTNESAYAGRMVRK